ncbi:MAG: nitroreductase family protein [Acidimicrobiia bacterium]
MEFREVLERRRMVRNYRNDPIDAGTLSRVAASALRGPSAGNSQGVSVVVVTDERRRQEIANLADEAAYVAAGFDPWISRAPAHIVISISEQIYHDRYREPDKIDDRGEEIPWPVPYWWVDAGAAMMAVLLAAVDEGLAAGFLGVHSIPDLRKLLEIPGEFSPLGVITVGHPAPDRRSKSLDRGQRPLEKTLHFETYTAP